MLRKFTAFYLIFAIFALSFVPYATAGFVPSGPIKSVVLADNADFLKIQSALEDRIVRQRLADLGYSAQEVMSKVSLMTSAQLHAMAQDIDNVRQGGILGAILLVVIIVLAVVGVMHLSGKKVTIK